MKSRWGIAFMLLGGVAGLVILGLAGIGAVSLLRRANTSSAPQAIPRMGIVLPPGFVADVYAEPEGAELPSVVTFGPDGALYLMTVSGKIFKIEDKDDNQTGEAVTVLYDNAGGALVQSVGLAFYEDKIYISDSGRISTLEDSDGDGTLDKLTPLVEGLPSLQFPDHSNNGIVFGPDGKLYVGVGATSDHSPAKDPLEASILRMNPDGSELEVFATGFRNPYDLTFSPDGALFTTDNNPSEMDATMRYLPPEELNHVQQGKDYGFPRSYGNAVIDGSAPPVTEFFASVGSAGMVYYAADAFPPEWRNGIYVAQWGTGANVALDRGITNGQSVVFTPIERTEDGNYRGDWKPFVVFDTDEGLRPVDVTVGPDGALYLLEFTFSTIYRVHYTGEVPDTTPTPAIQINTEPIPEFSQTMIDQGTALFQQGVEGAPPCSTCHLDAGRVGLGPVLAGLRDVAAARIPGLSAVEYVRQSILNPNAYIVPGFNAGYMFQNYSQALSAEQIDSLIAYVLTLEAE